ncbi:hypothetical protein F4777DRAFT_286244 [Nemania sp. FL0916]|nr:hypothetical protein F4777DRAFT_286244 [Nemania sp. FL0916]
MNSSMVMMKFSSFLLHCYSSYVGGLRATSCRRLMRRFLIYTIRFAPFFVHLQSPPLMSVLRPVSKRVKPGQVLGALSQQPKRPSLFSTTFSIEEYVSMHCGSSNTSLKQQLNHPSRGLDAHSVTHPNRLWCPAMGHPFQTSGRCRRERSPCH